MAMEETLEAGEAPADLVPPFDRPPDVVWQPDDVARVWEEDALVPSTLEGVARLDPFPRSQRHSFEAQRPAIASSSARHASSRRMTQPGASLSRMTGTRPDLPPLVPAGGPSHTTSEKLLGIDSSGGSYQRKVP